MIEMKTSDYGIYRYTYISSTCWVVVTLVVESRVAIQFNFTHVERPISNKFLVSYSVTTTAATMLHVLCMSLSLFPSLSLFHCMWREPYFF